MRKAHVPCSIKAQFPPWGLGYPYLIEIGILSQVFQEAFVIRVGRIEAPTKEGYIGHVG